MYPIGIPLLYAFILWVNRESLNPRVVAADPAPKEGEDEEAAAKAPVELNDLEQKLEERKRNPDLVPSMFLWKDFGEARVWFGTLRVIGFRWHLQGVLAIVYLCMPCTGVNPPAKFPLSEQSGRRVRYVWPTVAALRTLTPTIDPLSPTFCTGPDLYYYEVIECGRRILLTGVLIFIAPYSASQAAAACMFAFLSLLGFELLRPHLDPADSWLYRLVSPPT